MIVAYTSRFRVDENSGFCVIAPDIEFNSDDAPLENL